MSIRAIKVEDLDLGPDDSQGRLLFVLEGQKDSDDGDLIESLRADGLDVPVVTLYSGEEPTTGRVRASGVVELALGATEQSLRACLGQLGVSMKIEALEIDRLAVEQEDELGGEMELDLAGARETLIAEDSSRSRSAESLPADAGEEEVSGTGPTTIESAPVTLVGAEGAKDNSAAELEPVDPKAATTEEPVEACAVLEEETAEFESRLPELAPKVESLDMDEQELLRSLRDVQLRRSQLCQSAVDSAREAEERAEGYRLRLAQTREERLGDRRQTFTAERSRRRDGASERGRSAPPGGTFPGEGSSRRAQDRSQEHERLRE